MPSTFKLSIQPHLGNHLGQLTAHNAGAKAEYVGIIVQSGHFCSIRLAADTGADAFTLLAAREIPSPVPQMAIRDLPPPAATAFPYFLTINRVVTALGRVCFPDPVPHIPFLPKIP